MIFSFHYPSREHSALLRTVNVAFKFPTTDCKMHFTCLVIYPCLSSYIYEIEMDLPLTAIIQYNFFKACMGVFSPGEV